MTVTAKLIGVESLSAKLRAMVGAQAKATLQAANDKTGSEFMSLVRGACPVAVTPHGAHLIDTLKKETISDTGIAVQIGDGSRDYVAHLEFGHRGHGGGPHVPGKPFWYPARRVIKKRAANRASRAMRAAIRSAIASGAGAGA